MNEKSKCCDDNCITVSSDEGTGFYRCSSCGKSCDVKQHYGIVNNGMFNIKTEL